MWTYLTILLSISVALGVFIRRAVITAKGGEVNQKDIVKEAEKILEEKEMESVRQKRLSRSDKEKVDEFCKTAEKMIKQGNDEEAIKYFVQALAINELHVDTLQKLALLYMQKQMFGPATALLKRLTKLTEDPVHYSNLGLAHYQLQEYENSRDAYSKALSLDDSRAQRYVSLSQVYRALNQGNLAVVSLNKALEIEPDNIQFLLFLVDIQREMEDYEAALDSIRKVRTLDPELTEAKRLESYFRRMIRK